MHISCERNLLKNAIDQVSKVISSKQPLPILGHILFEAAGDKLKLTASSLEIGISCTIDLEEVREEGSTTCPAKVISEIVNSFPSGIVSLDIDTSVSYELTISQNRSVFKVMTLASEEFPKSINPQNCNSISIPIDEFRSAINKVSIAVADSSETRPIMQGISIDFSSDDITFVATDGKRLSKAIAKYSSSENPSQQVIVPGKPLTDLLKTFDKEDDVTIQYGRTHFFASSKNASFFCTLLEDSYPKDDQDHRSSYPNYERVIPKSFNTSCKMGREEIMAAIRSAIIMAKDKDIPNVIRFSFDKDSLVLTANSSNGEANIEVSNVIYSGEPMQIAFNGNYLLDVLKVLEDEEVIFKLQDFKSSMMVCGCDSEDSFIYICMPVRM